VTVRGTLRAACSPLAVASLALPLAIVAALAAAGAIPPDTALDAVSVRLWGAALLASGAGAAGLALATRRLAAAASAAAIVLAAALAAWGPARRLSGELDLGEGEAGARWRRLDRGFAADLPRVEVADLPAGGDVRLRVDGREVAVPPGAEVRVAGLDLRAEGPFPAPGFELRRASGEPVEALLVKLAPGERTLFQLGHLPHRFYARLPADASAAAPLREIALRIQRGKLRVLERAVAPGEPVAFEGLVLAFEPGARWVRVAVRRPAPRFAGAAALGFAALAAAAAVLARRRGGEA
jgi:hypothetical protein